MRRYPALRPDLYARSVNELITRAHTEQLILDVAFEARRISEVCGIAEPIVARDVCEAAVAARVALELSAVAPA